MSKYMRFVSVSTPNRDCTKCGPTDGSLAKARAVSVETARPSRSRRASTAKSPPRVVVGRQPPLAHYHLAAVCQTFRPEARLPRFGGESRSDSNPDCASKAHTPECHGRTGSTTSSPPTRRAKRGLIGQGKRSARRMSSVQCVNFWLGKAFWRNHV